MKIGVLALQGGYDLHRNLFNTLNVESIRVKYPKQLSSCDGLVIPGGESTSMSKLIRKYRFTKPIKSFAEKKPVFGTCAGLILMSSFAGDSKIEQLNILNIDVERNSWGRQINSFSKSFNVNLKNKINYDGVFIRAPKITSIKNSVKILAEIENEPVFIQDKNHLGAAFHPELTDDTRIHEYFISLVKA